MASNLWLHIMQEGFATVPSPLSKTAWNRIYALFDAFVDSVSLDPSAMQAFNDSAKEWQVRSGLSPYFASYFSPYFRDTNHKQGKDQKRIIQMCEPYSRYLDQAKSPLLDNHFYRALLDGLMAALYSTVAAIEPLLGELREDYPDVYNALVPDANLPPVALRLLSYSSDNAFATNPHVDKSAVTVIVDTDDPIEDPKLVYAPPTVIGTCPKLSHFRPVMRAENGAVMFLGAALQQAGYSEFTPLPHAVRPFRSAGLRHSAVFFWLLPHFDMKTFDTTVFVEDDLGLARTMAPKCLTSLM